VASCTVCVIKVVDFGSEIVENHKCTSDKCTSKGKELVGAGVPVIE
jgi:hypothetical protein